jgi:23S rRNA pseudouridine1911/1915/1917 synthase
VERFGNAAMVSVHPETGRTHQIRVHLSAAGHPILGDRVYGPEVVKGAPPAAPRQMLHARKLGFPHPESGRNVSTESPLPEDFVKVLAALRARKKSGPAEPGRAGAPKGSATRGR